MGHIMRRTTDPKVEQLATAELFWRCTPGELKRVAAIADQVELEAGRVLCTEGRHGTECFVLVDGEAEVTAGGEVIAVLGAGQVIGELSVIDQSGRSATVIARTPLTVFTIPSNRFDDLVEHAPGVAKGLLRQLSARVRALDLQVAMLAS
jgi:CRP-like cAMP-binding protein